MTQAHANLRTLADAAEKDGQHIYTNPRDSNSWQANEAWHKAAAPEVVIELLNQIEQLEQGKCLHQIAEPAASVEKQIKDAIDALVMAAFTEGGCSEHRMSEARIQTELRKKELCTLLSTPQPCSRSHPHEEMTPMCELRTEIARLTNALARAEAQLAAAQQGVQQAYVLEDDGHETYLDGCESRFSIRRADGKCVAWVTPLDKDSGEAVAREMISALNATHPTQQGLDDRDVFERAYAEHAIAYAGLDAHVDDVVQRVKDGRDGNSYKHLHDSGAWVGWNLALAAQAKQGGAA